MIFLFGTFQEVNFQELHDLRWYLIWYAGSKQIYLGKNPYLLNYLKNLMILYRLWGVQAVLKIKFWVTPICTKFVKATMLPAWRRIALKSLYLRMSLLQSLLPLRLEYWYGISFPDQIPPVNTLLKITPTLYWVICLNENLWKRLN